jgi:pimeloyl-ACP methyl ester carboxylesterase
VGLSTSQPYGNLLFEGCAAGKGQLVITLHKADGTVIGEGPGVWFDLKNIKSMYQGPGTTFQQPAGETPQAIVFVHGWNMSPDGSQNFAETAFKRLWHRGFKGRFVYFRWDTGYSDAFDSVPEVGDLLEAYFADYNGSERVAWQSGAALKTVVDGLPASYTRNIMAHSMGNIVAGSALLSGVTFDNYVLMQAAVPAACYDESEAMKQAPSQRDYPLPFIQYLGGSVTVTFWDNDTPDDDPIAETRALAYRGRLSGNRGNLINFFLPNDAATVDAWELNNDFAKPAANYGYTRGAPPVLGGQQALWRQVGTFQVSLTDPFEAMPLACRSWSKTIGAESRTAGSIQGSVNLGDPAYSLPNETEGFGTEHSAQFNRDIQVLKPFYDAVLRGFNIEPTS